MKRFVSSMLVMLCLSHATLVFAFQNEPDNFRGIKWGTNITELSDMRWPEDKADSKFYEKNNDKMKIGDADIESIKYGFYNGRFYRVNISFKHRINFSIILQALNQLYGSTNQLYGYSWVSRNVDISLYYTENVTIGDKNLNLNSGYLMYTFKPIEEEMKAAANNKKVNEMGL